MANRYDGEKHRLITLSASANGFFRCFRGIFLLSCLLLFAVSCSQINGGKLPVPDKNSSPDKSNPENASSLKIISKGTKLKELRQPRIYFRYIQYSVDGVLLGAHKLKDDYERNITLTSGKHILHVERLVRGMLSARAFILDEGDCYIFTLSEGQNAVFEGKAFPEEEWEKIGFAGVETWEKVDSIANCYE